MRAPSCPVLLAIAIAVAAWGAAGARAQPPDAGSAPAPSCEERIAARALVPPDARHTSYQRRLPEVLVRAEIDPVLFLRWPDAGPRTRRAVPLRRALDEAMVPARALAELLGAHASLALRREVLLSDGYLFSNRPALAAAFSSRLHLEQLFDAPRVYRARDGVVDVLERGDAGYLEPDGTRATLRPNDRVSERPEALAAPLGIDLEVVRAETGALRTLPIALGADAASIELRFPDGSRRPALVTIEHGRTEVVCIGGASETLAATQLDAERFWTRHRAVALAARALVDEGPRFDEPLDEPEGVQQDGSLRPAWLAAYESGQSTFRFGTVDYPVFDPEGRPIPPEVCIDFVFDAWQRASGTWYRREGEAPGHTHGALDLDLARLPRRSLTGLLATTQAEGAVLDRYDVREEDLVPLSRGAEYAQAVAREADAFREGDALVVYGLRLQDYRRHYHALLVIRTDPMTGVPMRIADNQGRPQFRTLESAMRAAPYRRIVHRLRLDLDALAALEP